MLQNNLVGLSKNLQALVQRVGKIYKLTQVLLKDVLVFLISKIKQ